MPVQIQRRGWGVARSKGERIPVRSLWKATSRTGSTIASTLYLKWKGERIPVRSFWATTSKTHTWVGCSLKSRGPAIGWVQIPVQGRLSTSAGQARPRIICGPASHLPTSYLLPPATILDLHGCSSRSSEEPCVCHHRRAGGPVTPTLTRVPCPPGWSVDRFTKTFFWKFQKCWVVLCYILIDKKMLH